jgi:hypothetical protein
MEESGGEEDRAGRGGVDQLSESKTKVRGRKRTVALRSRVVPLESTDTSADHDYGREMSVRVQIRKKGSRTNRGRCRRRDPPHLFRRNQRWRQCPCCLQGRERLPQPGTPPLRAEGEEESVPSRRGREAEKDGNVLDELMGPMRDE